ncbi:MAG: hypothetical protein DRI83_02680 [Bacteroidetes bacterium]|nr:MAG: hypothetical protein DRI83_02680 [Bacteroidota bacterium]
MAADDFQQDSLQDNSSIYNQSGEYQSSIDSLLRNLEIGQEQNDSILMLNSIHELANIYDEREKYDSALIFYKRAIRLAEATGDKASLASMQNNLGTIYLAWGNYQRAFNLYLSSLNICGEIEDSTGISRSLNNIGIIYSDWGEKGISLKYYRRSLEVDSLLGDIEGQSKTLNNIATLFDEMGDKERALRYYFRALGLAALTEDHYMIAVASSNIGGYYLEIEDLETAADYYFKTMEEYILDGSIIGQAETYILIGDLYQAQKEFSAALDYYTQGLEILVPRKLNWSIMNAYESMHQVYIEQGNYREALTYFSQFHDLKDSIFSIETSTQLALLTNAYEIQQKDQEMELQQVRMNEQKAKIRWQRSIMIILGVVILTIIIFALLLARQYRLRMKAWKQLLVQHKEILRNRQELIIAKEQAEESDRLKSTFLVNISHELRTPMNGIMGFTDLLQKGSVTPDKHQLYLSYIASSSRQLLKVLNDIIDISSIETKQLKLDIRSCSLHQIFKDLLEYFNKEKAESNKEKIELICKLPPEAGQHSCMGDAKRLSQVVFNLLNNALMFTKEGSIEFGYKIIDKKSLLLYVKDTGIGIERSNFDLIFERFRQVDDSTTRQHSGSGLGLSICKELANLMNGRIYLESELGKGSTFYVEIPFVPAG